MIEDKNVKKKQDIKIVHLNEAIVATSVPYRIQKALKNEQCISVILTRKSQVSEDGIYVVKEDLMYRALKKVDDCIVKFQSRKYPEQKKDYPFSYYHVGMNVQRNPLVTAADVIFIHWVAAGYMSINDINMLIRSGKKVVFVCHDNGHFTGGCHVRMGCQGYRNTCGKCPILCSEDDADWSYQQIREKDYNHKNVIVVSPSRWMDENVSGSSVFKGVRHYIIPNPINTEVFRPLDKYYFREKYGIKKSTKVILFGAVKATSTPYKGFQELKQALMILSSSHSEYDIELFIFGSDGDSSEEGINYNTHYFGYLDEERLNEAYNIADIYVVPSLEDSFNNTVAESLSATTPVVAFKTGGIVDIIDHKQNGYLAEYADSEDLAAGMIWVLENNQNNALGKNGRNKVKDFFSDSVVANKYMSLIQEL